jgi:hypothetical protein
VLSAAKSLASDSSRLKLAVDKFVAAIGTDGNKCEQSSDSGRCGARA